jgi:choline-sulfatase
MRHSLLAALVLFLTSSDASADDSPGPRRSVLFIAIDDLNDWVGPLKGHPLVKTPNFDRLAARGTTFTNAHCQAPLCNPSRTSVMLGLRPTTTGVYALEPWFRTVPALADRVPLMEHFHSSGYRTMTVGKIWHGPFPPPKDRARELDDVGQPTRRQARPPRPFTQTPGGHPLVDWGPFPERDEDHPDYGVAEWAVGQLRSRPKEPFFLGVGFALPHVPCYAPQKWFDLYPEGAGLLPEVPVDDRSDVPFFAWRLHWQLPEPRLKWLKSADEWEPLVRAYLASISFMDAQVGRVLDALDESGRADETIVVLWSDHGWHLGEKDISGKNTLWERSTRVPLIFTGPGIGRGVKCSSPAELLDLYPTLIELCGLPPRDDLEGHSLVPQLRDPRATRPWPAITSHGPGNHGVRDERWRYIRYADGSEELYDVIADPHEWNNRAADPAQAPRKAAMAELLPATSAVPVPGSRSRLIELKDGVVYWENQRIEGTTVPD